VNGARLTALRLVGFKSFAERTTIEFGAGISAVVGPNGSGKSNLADALRWTLGEQGRSLRTRRSEDVIFAGSSARRAIGMADVTLIIDNRDRLLPVDYGEVEIGRRLYRSGENEYLLNRQRIRLRDLVELLDAGNLADNAFLFIGQGMVDQALALRPEERRPLFEEAAGIRRHERRRRQAESELVEAEANLERLRDVLAELRPQARRLAAQAEQLQARRSAGVELAEALLAAARARWVALSSAAAKEGKEVHRARAAADAALAELKAAEEETARLAAEIGRRAEAERAERVVLDQVRERLTQLRVAQARLESELDAQARDLERIAADQSAGARRRAEATAALSQPASERDPALEAELEYVERELAVLEAGSGPAGEGGAARAVGAPADIGSRRRDVEHQRRRLQALEAGLAEATTKADEVAARQARAEIEHTAAKRALSAATSGEKAAQAELLGARTEWQAAGAAHAAAVERASATEAEVAGARGRLAALEASLAAATDDGLARAARARGASLLAEGLEVDARFRAAVSAALGSAALAFVVAEDAVAGLAARRGTLALSGAAGRPTPPAAGNAIVEAATAAGGGRLGDAVRRDPQSRATHLLERVVWLPNLAPALRLRGALPPGWRAVTLAGEVVGDEGLVQLAGGASVLDQRAECDAQQIVARDLEQRLEEERTAAALAARSVSTLADQLTAAQNRHELARRETRAADEAERLAQRRAEQSLREATWQAAQAERGRAETETARALVARLADDLERLERDSSSGAGAAGDPAARQRGAELRARAAELRGQLSAQSAASAAAQEARRRAEIALALDEARLRDLEAETQRIALRDAELADRRAELESALGLTQASEAEAAAGVETAFASSAQDRARLAELEAGAGRARDSLRSAEARSREAEVRAMEARLLLEQNREQLLVELAGIGDDGTAALARAAGDEPGATEDADARVMEEVLGRVLERWAGDRSAVDAVSAGRLASLRRRFHELGAGNPYAVEEYAELRERLESLDGQRVDIESAIVKTRDLIGSLSTLINDQFRSTFAALEDAFARRFHELFGGGDAQLSLTAPDDLSTTGVDIHARPPGKKRQPLAMLSGGERALTAVSLLLAMLEVRPVPFCVLDEVDAALDEANIGRFAKALRGLAADTQFIVITHNRGTIEAADALYGVTIGEDAVSRVVSLRLPGSSANGERPAGALAETAAS
jgi:chromosome segregation protein